MRNLAGDHECDAWIKYELTRARIPIEQIEVPHGSEVPYRMIGRLGPIEFRRAWTYWVSNGPVTIEIARRLYADPVGRTDVRVAGHCGCPEPSEPQEQWWGVDPSPYRPGGLYDAGSLLRQYELDATEAAYRLIETSATLRREWFGAR